MWLRSLTHAGRQNELDAQAEVLAVRETFLAGYLEAPRDAVPIAPAPRTSLVGATVAQAQAYLSVAAARREQEHRQFVETLTNAQRRWSVAR
jgi:hypothetical protein